VSKIIDYLTGADLKSRNGSELRTLQRGTVPETILPSSRTALPSISETTALRVADLYAAVRVLADGVASLPPKVYRETPQGRVLAGVNAKALSTFMGHANISITLDRYGHLFPGSEDEAAGLLDTYLAAQLDGAADAARAAGDPLTGAQTGAQVGRTAEKRLEQAG
jgi:hypothetical protein